MRNLLMLISPIGQSLIFIKTSIEYVSVQKRASKFIWKFQLLFQDFVQNLISHIYV